MFAPTIRRPLKIAALIVSLCILLTACGKADYHSVDGGSGRFADLRGKWVFINYWAEWCKPCIKEIPELNNFHREFSAQATVLGVNYDNPDAALLKQQIQKLKIEFGVFDQDPSTALGYARPEALPTTFVFDPDGKLVATLLGPQTIDTLKAAMTPTAPEPQRVR